MIGYLVDGRAVMCGGDVSTLMSLGMTIVRCERSSLTTAWYVPSGTPTPAGVNESQTSRTSWRGRTLRWERRVSSLLPCESSIHTSMLSLLRTWNRMWATFFAGSLLSGEKTCACCVP